jgi:hypothetical protein
VKFRADLDGFVTRLRFYKGPQNTGSHVGHLWTSTGTLLASVTFTGASASGWQQVTLPTPVAVTAGTTYVASYHAPVGRYAFNSAYFTAEYVKAPLRGPRNRHQVQLAGEAAWMPCKHLYDKATSTPQALGQARLTEKQSHHLSIGAVLRQAQGPSPSEPF